MPGDVRIMVAAPYPIVAWAFGRLVKNTPSWHLLDCASDGAETNDKCEDLQPDLLLMVMPIPGPSPTELVRRIRDACPDTRVMVLSLYDDSESALAMHKAGANGIVSMRDSLQTIKRAIEMVTTGESWLSPVCALHGVPRAPATQPEYCLTDRQWQVLDALVAGKTGECIAEEIGVSPRTVARDVRRLLDLLGLGSRMDLAAWAVHNESIWR